MKKANDIQLGCETEFDKGDNVETLRLVASCYMKLKEWGKALEFNGKVLGSVEKKMGKRSK